MYEILKGILLLYINYKRFVGSKQVGDRLHEGKYKILKAI
jgi:hypothetical protein